MALVTWGDGTHVTWGDGTRVRWGFDRPASSKGEWVVKLFRANRGNWSDGSLELDLSEWVQKDSLVIERPLRKRGRISFKMEIPLIEAPPLADWPKRKPPPYSIVKAWWRSDLQGVQSDVLEFAGPILSAPITSEPGVVGVGPNGWFPLYNDDGEWIGFRAGTAVVVVGRKAGDADLPVRGGDTGIGPNDYFRIDGHSARYGVLSGSVSNGQEDHLRIDPPLERDAPNGTVLNKVSSFYGGWLSIDCSASSLDARMDHRRIEGYERTIDGETQAQLIARMGRKYLSEERIDTAMGVVATDVVKPDVFNWIKYSEFLDRLADESNSVWHITPLENNPDYDGLLEFEPRTGIENATYELNLLNTSKILLEDELQRHRTRQTVIGAGPKLPGQLLETFTGDGRTREFILKFRLDRIIDIAENGVSQDFGGEDDGHRWIVDSSRSTIRLRDGQPTPVGEPNPASIEVLYDYKDQLISTDSADSDLVEHYGIIHDVIRDSALETNEEADAVRDRELHAHDNPDTRIKALVDYGAIPHALPGEIVPLFYPHLGIVNENWLAGNVRSRSEGDTRIYEIELLAGDYEHLDIDWYRRLNQLTEPTESAKPLRSGGDREIDPNLLLHEGFRLPAPMGGTEQEKVRDNQWRRVPGSGLIVIDGSRLPRDLGEYHFTAQAHSLPAGVMGQVRLYNATDGVAMVNNRRQTITNVTSEAARPYALRGLTFTPKVAWYEIQSRVTADTPRGSGLAVWNARADVRA